MSPIKGETFVQGAARPPTARGAHTTAGGAKLVRRVCTGRIRRIFTSLNRAASIRADDTRPRVCRRSPCLCRTFWMHESVLVKSVHVHAGMRENGE